MKLMIFILLVFIFVLFIPGLQLPFVAADEYYITGHQQGIQKEQWRSGFQGGKLKIERYVHAMVRKPCIPSCW